MATKKASIEKQAEDIKREKAKEVSEADLLRAEIEKLKAQLYTEKEQKVVLRFQAECSDINKAIFGPNGVFGQVTGKVGRIYVPKEQWSQFYDETVQHFLKKRILIVESGLSEEEKEIYGVNYKEGEILSEKDFFNILDMGEKLLKVYPKLCEEHQKVVAKRFCEASVRGDHRALDRNLVLSLNRLSKKGTENLPKNSVKRKGLFYPIIEKLNQADDQ